MSENNKQVQELNSSSSDSDNDDHTVLNKSKHKSSAPTSSLHNDDKDQSKKTQTASPRIPSTLAAKMAAMVNRSNSPSAGGQPVGSSLKSIRQAPSAPLHSRLQSLNISNESNHNHIQQGQQQSPQLSNQQPSLNDNNNNNNINNNDNSSLAARRGAKLNLNQQSQSTIPTPPLGLKRRGPPGKLNLSNADDTPFSNFSNIVDPSGKLNFGQGKAVLHASGVNFSTGHSFSIKIDDLELLDELGRGAYGSVRKARHKVTGVIMAIKEIRLELDKTKLAGIAMELDILHKAVKPQIVEFYGAFFVEGCIFYCMEFMDAGSLDKLYKPNMGIPQNILAYIIKNLIYGLQFLKDELSIIHRDVKPTNILVNRRGKVKICDFGVSGQLEKSLAKTNIGCQSYMAPERIQSPHSGVHRSFYSVSSDVWSLGLSMVECASGSYPYTFQNVLAQLQEIVKGPPPELPSSYTHVAKDFVQLCLRKDPNERPGYKELLQHEFLSSSTEPDMVIWIEEALRATHEGYLPDPIPESEPSTHFSRSQN